MEREKFVKVVYESIAKKAVEEVLQNLKSPPGRNPNNETIRRSEGFKNLTVEEKELCMDIAQDAVDAAFFGLFCVLDGVRNIDNTINSSRLRLTLEKEKEKLLLSDNTEYLGLHDIYNTLSK